MTPAENLILAVNGTLMRGLELNANLVEAGGEFLREDRTEPHYRLWSIGDRHPAMQRCEHGGVSVALELWKVSPAGLARILWQEPAGLCIGKIKLIGGQSVLGVLGEAVLCEQHVEISAWGSWRAYMAHRAIRRDP